MTTEDRLETFEHELTEMRRRYRRLLVLAGIAVLIAVAVACTSSGSPVVETVKELRAQRGELRRPYACNPAPYGIIEA